MLETIARTLDSVSLYDAYLDFLISRQAKQCSTATMEFYKYTAEKFLHWAETQGVKDPAGIDSSLVRQYLAKLISEGKRDTTVHDNARALRTLLKFWNEESYIEKPIRFDMPKVARRRLPTLTAEQLKQAIDSCQNKRDKALLLFLADSGLRRAEVVALNWDDVDIQTGLVRVKRGKGGKARSAVISPTTRRALLQYRRTIKYSSSSPLFLSRTKERLTGTGVLIIFRRLSKQTGLHITPHCLRRTFTILSLRAGMSVLHLQNLGGWASMDLVNRYAQMVDDDLLQAHSAHSPVESL